MNNCPRYLHFLYSAKKGPAGKPSSILFLERLGSIFNPHFANKSAQVENVQRAFKLFVTNAALPKDLSGEERLQAIRLLEWNADCMGSSNVELRRFEQRDLEVALGPVKERNGIVAYVCGPPAMTDWAVGVLREAKEMQAERVLCEKWW